MTRKRVSKSPWKASLVLIVLVVLGNTPCQRQEPMTEAAKKARLRRICERKPSGKILCPEWLHEQWKSNSDRDSMVEQLEKCNWQKADFTFSSWSCMAGEVREDDDGHPREDEPTEKGDYERMPGPPDCVNSAWSKQNHAVGRS